MRYYNLKLDSYCKIPCPYYETEETKLKLSCAGLCGARKTTLVFESEEKKNDFILSHCMQYPSDCPIQIMKEVEEEHDE